MQVRRFVGLFTAVHQDSMYSGAQVYELVSIVQTLMR